MQGKPPNRLIRLLVDTGIRSSELLGLAVTDLDFEQDTAGYRRLSLCDERHAHLFCAFLTLAAALTCYKKLTT